MVIRGSPLLISLRHPVRGRNEIIIGITGIEYLIASGVHGIINGGSTGEYYAQSMEERVEMARFAKARFQ